MNKSSVSQLWKPTCCWFGEILGISKQPCTRGPVITAASPTLPGFPWVWEERGMENVLFGSAHNNHYILTFYYVYWLENTGKGLCQVSRFALCHLWTPEWGAENNSHETPAWLGSRLQPHVCKKAWLNPKVGDVFSYLPMMSLFSGLSDSAETCTARSIRHAPWSVNYPGTSYIQTAVNMVSLKGKIIRMSLFAFCWPPKLWATHQCSQKWAAGICASQVSTHLNGWTLV